MGGITNYPKVSIIVPVYNVEKYLHKCIDSILNQTYRNFELILVNDGSTDKSGEICDKYALMDKRIQVLHKINEGVSVARNIGIEVSVGEWCCFIDSDDYVKSSYLESFILNLSAGVYFYMDRGYNIDDGCDIYYQGIPYEKKISSMIDLYTMGELYNVINSPCMKFFSNQLIKDNNIRFNKNFSYGEDHLFVLDYLISLDTFNGLLIEDDGYCYLKEQGRMSLTSAVNSCHSSEKIFQYAKESYERRKKLIEKNKILDLDFLNLVEKQTKVYMLISAINTVSTNENRIIEFEKIKSFYCGCFKNSPWTTSRYYNLIAYSLLNLSYKSTRYIVISLSFFLQFFKFIRRS